MEPADFTAVLLPQGVANRDIKLENTLLDGSPRPLLKICDFGYSKVPRHGTLLLPWRVALPAQHLCTCHGKHSRRLAAALQHEKFQSAPGSRVGTPAYLAPEVIMTTKGQTYDGKVCRWCLFAAVSSGHLPGLLVDACHSSG